MKKYYCKDCKKEVSRKGLKRCRKCYVLFNRGKNNSMWIPDIHCTNCGKIVYKYAKGIRCRTCNNKFQSGNKNGRFIDGRSYEHYPSEFNEKLREVIRNRDNNRCVVCGMTKEEHYEKYNRNLEVHHKDHNRNNCKEENLETNCKKCNIQDNFK